MCEALRATHRTDHTDPWDHPSLLHPANPDASRLCTRGWLHGRACHPKSVARALSRQAPSKQRASEKELSSSDPSPIRATALKTPTPTPPTLLCSLIYALRGGDNPPCPGGGVAQTSISLLPTGKFNLVYSRASTVLFCCYLVLEASSKVLLRVELSFSVNPPGFHSLSLSLVCFIRPAC